MDFPPLSVLQLLCNQLTLRILKHIDRSSIYQILNSRIKTTELLKVFYRNECTPKNVNLKSCCLTNQIEAISLTLQPLNHHIEDNMVQNSGGL
jgi:hypothetical protein